MKRKTAMPRASGRIAVLMMLASFLAGCSTYYQSYYPDSGVYYGDSGVYGHAGAATHGGYGYRTVNPAVYPYWSIDYFYFSQYYHPYSVFVGYNEPLYYPYPGWVFGDYRAVHPRGYASFAFGFGYPWYGYGHRYPGYSLGFFSGYSPYYYGGGYYAGDRYGRHRIRQIDRRIEALQEGGSYASRRQLLGRDRVAGNVGSGVYDSRSNNRTATRSRADLLRQRSIDGARTSQRRAVAPDRSARLDRRLDRRVERRAPDVRSERRPNRGSLDRDRIRRDGGGSAYEGHRGIPIENLRGRVIVNSRSARAGDLDRDAIARDRAGTARNIRRAPAIEWNRGENRSRPKSAGTRQRSRGSLLNRSTRSSAAPLQRPDRGYVPSSRPAREISRPEPATRASSTSRRSLMRQPASGSSRDNRRGNKRR